MTGTDPPGDTQAFAKEEARRLASEHPEWNWTNVPTYEKSRVRDSINGQLRREGIAPLGEDIIRWRMSICIRDVKQWAGASPFPARLRACLASPY
jgi:hypothetical protein